MLLKLQGVMVRAFSTIKDRSYAFLNSSLTQGVRGHVGLITGNFSFFTKQEAAVIQAGISGGKIIVLVYDRDSISVPANERAMWIREHFNYHPNLEVRVAYGAPPEAAGSEALYFPYIKKQLPAYVRVTSVLCKNPYSSLLAKDFQVVYVLTPGGGFKESEDIISRDPKAHESLITPIAVPRVISPFNKIIDPLRFDQQCELAKRKVRDVILRRNTEHPNRGTFFERTKWDTTQLNRVNLPVIIGSVENRIGFSNPTNSQVFDMPIYMPGQGWRIPTELMPYRGVLAKIVAAESLANPKMAECNAYVTVDCNIVFPSGFARRGGLHVDGFLTNANARSISGGVIWGDNTYIVSDNFRLQTEFYPGPFDLSGINKDDPQAVLNAFELQGQSMLYLQYNPYDIVRLTTNNVHAVHANLTSLYLQRCFLKMTFSERSFNRGGNTINPNFNYRFVYVPRGSGRNTQNYIGVAPAGFEEVDLRDVDFTNLRLPRWLSSTPFDVCKKTDVRVIATPATEGETLVTEVGGDKITMNIARAGDIKVTRARNDSYFLGSSKFSLLYAPTDNKDEYKPNPRRLRAIPVQKDITFQASWGTRQNIPSGGYIVGDSEGEVWGVHGNSFGATYQEFNSSPQLK